MTTRAFDGKGATAEELWSATFQILANELRREQIQTWFVRVGPVSFQEHELVLAVPSEFLRAWLTENYTLAIQQALRMVIADPVSIRFVVDPEKASFAALSLPSLPATAPPQNSVATQGNSTTQSSASSSENNHSTPGSPPLGAKNRNHHFSPAPKFQARAGSPVDSRHIDSRQAFPKESFSQLSLNPNYTFSNFVVGPCNRFAYAGAMGVAENPAKAYNPLFLHGSVGLGKTHLLQGICYGILSRKPDTRILYLSCETFTNHFIAALEKGALEEFRRRYRGVDILVIDDIHFLANKERTQEEFFHTFNALFQDEKQIVLSSDSPAREIPTLQERLVSRFKWGLEAEIEKPCFETRIAILQRKARTMGVTLADDVTQYLAERVTNNIRELEGAINRVVGFAGLQRESISVDLARRIMPELDAERSTIVRFEDIAGVVSKKYHLKILDLQSRRRHQSIALPRQIAMFLARKHTKHSLEEIGAYFGGRDHTTVMYAIQKIDDLVAGNTETRDTINSLLDEISRSLQKPTS